MPKNDIKPLGALDPDRDAWDRQAGETVKRHGQFIAFRDLGRTRTVRKVAEDLALSESYLRAVAAAMLWRDRAERWDIHRDELDDAAWLEARRRAAKADAKLLDGFATKVTKRIIDLDPAELAPADLVRALDVVMKHRRALFGDPAATIAVTGPAGSPLTVQFADLAGMTAETRQRAVTALAEDVLRRSTAAAGAGDDDE